MILLNNPCVLKTIPDHSLYGMHLIFQSTDIEYSRFRSLAVRGYPKDELIMLRNLLNKGHGVFTEYSSTVGRFTPIFGIWIIISETDRHPGIVGKVFIPGNEEFGGTILVSNEYITTLIVGCPRIPPAA